MTPAQEHALSWNDRLQDWLDGDAAPSEQAELEMHLAACEQCRAQMARFSDLDRLLQQAAPALALDATFDARLFAQIDSIDEAQRAAARQRVERELQENLAALQRSWRRMLAFIVPGVIAGVALAFTLTGYFVSADVAHTLIEQAEPLAMNNASGHIATMLTAVFGAAIGAAVARWLAAAAA
jgi:anti-sigma factor RsiW